MAWWAPVHNPTAARSLPSDGAEACRSPDFVGLDPAATCVEATAAVVPADKWTVSAAIGYQSLDVNNDDTTWSVGVGCAFTDPVSIDVRDHDNAVDGLLPDGRAMAGLQVLF